MDIRFLSTSSGSSTEISSGRRPSKVRLYWTTRGGDFELNIGRTSLLAISATQTLIVRLYLQETFTFRVLTSEASVVLSSSDQPSA